jgi:hypothetical protein
VYVPAYLGLTRRIKGGITPGVPSGSTLADMVLQIKMEAWVQLYQNKESKQLKPILEKAHKDSK